jgi:membrane protease YdiL (CAAX protease family)
MALTARDLGLCWHGAVRSAGIGLLVALALALPAVLFLLAPPLIGNRVTHAPLSSLTMESVLWRAFAWMPLDTALPEEVAFRGVLLAGLLRHLTTSRAVLISALAFTLWHVVIVSRTLSVTNLSGEPLLLILGTVGAFTSVFIGGIVFAALRLRTGNLAASIVAHWAFNTVLLIGLTVSVVQA